MLSSNFGSATRIWSTTHMSFSIEYVSRSEKSPELGNSIYRGRIVLDDYRESFESLIGYWSPADYQAQWQSGLERIADENNPSCLITSVYDPENSEYLTWWLLYPLRDRIAVQNQLLLFANLARPFELATPFESVPARRTVSTEGDPISEWTVARESVVAFLRTPGRKFGYSV